MADELYVPCLFCGGNRNEADHAARCDGKQGAIEHAIDMAQTPTLVDRSPVVYTPPGRVDSPAFEGLSSPALDAILDAVTVEEVDALVRALTAVPQPADAVRVQLCAYPWFPSHATRDTQLRRIRTLRDAAVAYGHPVCSTNAGYSLGDVDEVHASALRARRFADGAIVRAQLLERLAERMGAKEAR